MEEIKIYTPADELLLSVFVDDSSYRLREIMGSNTLQMSFALHRYVAIPEGSYCEFKAERYWMPRSTNYVKEHTEKFTYNLLFEGSVNFLKSTKFKFFDYLNEGSTVKPTSSFKLKFPLTATPADFVALLVANLKLKYPEYPWAVGECIDSEPVTLDFNHDFCFDLLPKLAEAFSTEWELDKYTLHIQKVEKMKDSAIDLSYGYNNGILAGIERIQYDSTKIINRVYVEGTDRNIDFSTYKNDTLLLPKSKKITYKGIEYSTDASGSYLERSPSPTWVGAEDSLDITKHYPKRVGVVSAVEKIDDAQGFYNIIDGDIPAELDYSKHIIEGETMTVIFQTGQLAGKEFDAKYFHDTKKFELVPITDGGLVYPQGNIIPEVGDKYAVFHMSMPSLYIDNAENEALQDVVKYLWENEQAQYSYRWSLDGIYAKRNWGEIRGYLNCGYFVKFSDPQFLPDGVDVRIVAVKEMMNDDQSPEITIANNVSSKTFGSILNKIPTIEQAVDRKDTEIKRYVKRGFKQSLETLQQLIDAGLDFDDAIMPIVVRTMMVLVGDESLQFRFVDQKENPSAVPSGIAFNAVDKVLTCPDGIMQHMTLGITSISSSHAADEYKFWDTKAYRSDELMESKHSYYLYLKCPIADYTDGGYILSREAITMDAEAGFYHFLVGTLGTEDEEGNRSFVELFGLTEVLPGRITTDRIVSGDGKSFFDMLNNQLNFGNENSGFDWNVTQAGQFTIRGLINAIGAVLGGFKIDNDKFSSVVADGQESPLVIDGRRGSITSQSPNSFGVGRVRIQGSTLVVENKMLNGDFNELFSIALETINAGGTPPLIRIVPIIKASIGEYFIGMRPNTLYKENGFVKIYE